MRIQQAAAPCNMAEQTKTMPIKWALGPDLQRDGAQSLLVHLSGASGGGAISLFL